MTVNLALLARTNAARWAAMQVHSDRSAEFDRAASRLLTDRARFAAVQARTGVPWWVVAVIHARESGGKFSCYLGNGQPLETVTTEVPAGRGPFRSWEDGAVDALMDCAPHAGSWHDWTVGGALALLERYNGTGYAAMGRPSPYLWSGTNQYARGKYVADHQFDPNAIDRQLGCAPLLAAMRRQDRSIRFDGETSPTGGHAIAVGGAIASGAMLSAAGVPMWVTLGMIGATLAAVALSFLWWGKHHG